MILTGRKSQSKTNTGSDWALILKPIHSELHKTAIIEKIVEVFPVSFPEATDLVSRTPIVLLDQMPLETVEKVKEVFNMLGAEILLTADSSVKRKCFRTIWPDVPKLKIQNEKVYTAKVEKIEPLVVPMPEASKPSERLSRLLQTEQQHPVLNIAELEEKKKAIENLKGENQRLLNQLEETRKEVQVLKHHDEVESRTDSFGRSSLELESLKMQIEEKEVLIHKAERESQKALEQVRHEQDEKRKLKELMTDMEQENRQLRTVRDAHTELQNRYNFLESELRSFALKKNELEELKNKFQNLSRAFGDQEKQLEFEHEKFDQLKGRFDKLESDLSVVRIEEVKWKKQNSDLLIQLDKLSVERNQAISEKEQQERFVSEMSQKLSRLEEESAKTRSTFDALRRQIASLESERERDLSQFKKEKESLFELIKEKEDKILNTERKRQEFETQYKQAHDLTIKLKQEIEDRMKQVEQIEKTCDTLRHTTQQSQDRQAELERSFENAQKMIREMNNQKERHDMIQKKMRLQGDSQEKEIRMKELVMKQQQLEQEIMEREKSIKEILKAQESVEKELVTFKQAQKHIDEQLKIKSKGNSISIDSPTEV